MTFRTSLLYSKSVTEKKVHVKMAEEAANGNDDDDGGGDVLGVVGGDEGWLRDSVVVKILLLSSRGVDNNDAFFLMDKNVLSAGEVDALDFTSA